jgi:hypothetical protein
LINKVDGVGGVRTPQQVKRPTKVGGSDSTAFAKHLDDSSPASASTATSGVSSVSALLGAQEVDDALARASKGKARAEDMLELLDNLRLELLLGGVSRERLMQLARIVSARRPEIADPRLASILDEIDLRAQVELAKHAQT